MRMSITDEIIYCSWCKLLTKNESQVCNYCQTILDTTPLPETILSFVKFFSQMMAYSNDGQLNSIQQIVLEQLDQNKIYFPNPQTERQRGFSTLYQLYAIWLLVYQRKQRVIIVYENMIHAKKAQQQFMKKYATKVIDDQIPVSFIIHGDVAGNQTFPNIRILIYDEPDHAEHYLYFISRTGIDRMSSLRSPRSNIVWLYDLQKKRQLDIRDFYFRPLLDVELNESNIVSFNQPKNTVLVTINTNHFNNPNHPILYDCDLYSALTKAVEQKLQITYQNLVVGQLTDFIIALSSASLYFLGIQLFDDYQNDEFVRQQVINKKFRLEMILHQKEHFPRTGLVEY